MAPPRSPKFHSRQKSFVKTARTHRDHTCCSVRLVTRVCGFCRCKSPSSSLSLFLGCKRAVLYPGTNLPHTFLNRSFSIRKKSSTVPSFVTLPTYRHACLGYLLPTYMHACMHSCIQAQIHSHKRTYHTSCYTTLHHMTLHWIMHHVELQCPCIVLCVATMRTFHYNTPRT